MLILRLYSTVKGNQRCTLEDRLLEIANDSSYFALFLHRRALTWVTWDNFKDLDAVDRIGPGLHHSIQWPEEGAVSQGK